MQEDLSLLQKSKLKPYNVFFTQSIFEELPSIFAQKNLKKTNAIFIISDHNVAKLYLQNLELTLKNAGYEKVFSIVIKTGEKSKSLVNYNKIIKKISQYNELSRDSAIIALGGGVVGDLAGFCASTILRGINFINIPTTLLAMSDSSIGGKNGINTSYGKNSLGSFYTAHAVVIAPQFLQTLNQKEFNSGFFEILKISLIKDKTFFNYLEENYNKIIEKKHKELSTTILTSIEHKLKIVEDDFLEQKQLRYLLNYGHTYGHALEKYLNYNKISHGHAVAIGMICANFLSYNLKLLSQDVLLKANNSIKNKLLKSPINLNKINHDKLYSFMLNDKKQSDGSVNAVVLESIGKAIFLTNIKQNTIKQSITQGFNFIK